MAVLAILCVPLIGGAWFLMGGWGKTRQDLILHKVKRERLDLTIVERGALESAYNNDVTCRVKSGQKGGGYATTIKWIIDDGSLVKGPLDVGLGIFKFDGDKILELDKSGLEDQLTSQRITLEQAKAAFEAADANYKIVASQNKSDLQTAIVALDLARIDLEKYKIGDYPQSLKDIQSRKEIAESDLEMWRDRSAWSERMSKKGYLSPSQVQAERSRLRSAELGLQKVDEELRVLDLTKLRTVKDLESKVQEAERAQERVMAQAKAKETQAMTDLRAKESVAKQEESRQRDISDEIAKCTVCSPQDGMVVYYVSESSRSGSSTRQSIVAQGEPVSEGQKLMRIPDLRHMQVAAKVHEALVSRVRVDQPAVVRVDAFPTRNIPGRVKQVAAVASQADWFSTDVKVYQCNIALDEFVEGLKPGMSAEVTILVGGVLENILTIPIHAIVGSAELGKERKCFVMTPNGPEERRIVIGLSNDKMAEVRSGLEEGDEVVLNPRAILGDASKTREASVEKVRVSFDGGEPKSKGPKAGNPPETKAPTDDKRAPTTAKTPNPNKKKGPTSAE